MKISREVKTAILVLGAIALFIWGYSFLKGRNIFDNSTKYYVEYDNVEGLATSANVTINGLTVGKVSRIDINNQTGKLTVELLMTKPMPIGKESIATIYSPGLLGGKGIMIDPKFGSTEYAESGQTLKGSIQLDITEKLISEIEPLKVEIEKIMSNANTMLVAFNSVLDEKTQADLRNSIAELNGTLAGANRLIAGVEPQMKGTMKNLNTMSQNFVEVSQDLKELDINGMFNNLEKASSNIDKILADIENGNGSVGKLLKDEELYKNLTGASKELELLMRDLKENPKRYVHFSLFGKKAEPYKEEIKEVSANISK